MAKKQGDGKRTRVEELPREEEELGAEEAKGVKGGADVKGGMSFGVEREMKDGGERSETLKGS